MLRELAYLHAIAVGPLIGFTKGRQVRNELFSFIKQLEEIWLAESDSLSEARGGGILPIVGYTGRLRTKGVVFSRWKYVEGLGFHAVFERVGYLLLSPFKELERKTNEGT